MDGLAVLTSDLDLTAEDKALVAQAFESTTLTIEDGPVPIQILALGTDIDVPLAWIAISFIGTGAAMLLNAFVKELGSELGKATYKKLQKLAMAQRERETVNPSRGRPYNRYYDHPFDIVLVYQWDKDIFVLAELPESCTTGYDAIIASLRDAVDRFLGQAPIDRVALNVVLARFVDDEWKVFVVDVPLRNGVYFELELRGIKIF